MLQGRGTKYLVVTTRSQGEDGTESHCDLQRTHVALHYNYSHVAFIRPWTHETSPWPQLKGGVGALGFKKRNQPGLVVYACNSSHEKDTELPGLHGEFKEFKISLGYTGSSRTICATY